MPFLRKYNTLLVTGTTAIQIPIIKRGVVDFAVGADWTPATGDVKILVDNTAAANVTNLPTAKAGANTGAIWEFVLTAAELSCKQAIIIISDAATKAIEDQCFIVETYGNASAMYAADLSLANLPANVTQLLGTAWLTPGTAGTPDVNAKLAAGASWPANFTSLVIDSTGRVNAFLIGILTSVFTEGATGRVAAAFKQWFNVASPASTMEAVTLVATATNLTNAPTSGDLTATMKTSVTTAATAATPTIAGYTGNTPQTGDSFARLGAPAGASHSADVAAVKVDTAAVKVQTDKLTFTVPNQVDSNVLDWKSSTAPAMTGDAYARLGAPAGASISADIAEVEGETDAIIATLGSPAGASISADIAEVEGETDGIASIQTDTTALLALVAATAIRAALGLASANLDTQLAEIEGETDGIAALNNIAAGAAMTLTAGERDSIATALLDLANGIETGITLRQAHRVELAAAAGKLSGAATATVKVRNQADSKDRITATTDADGNRTAITLDLT